MESISQRQSQQTLADEYRTTLADAQAFLEGLTRRLDGVEPGTGLDCQHKLTTLAQVHPIR